MDRLLQIGSAFFLGGASFVSACVSAIALVKYGLVGGLLFLAVSSIALSLILIAWSHVLSILSDN